MDHILHKELINSLLSLRAQRGFDPEKYIRAKIHLLNSYMRNSHLKSCVVGVSGGIDSAVTLALLCKAAKEENSPIKRIVAVLMPLFVPEGATQQDMALQRGLEVAQAYGVECITIDLSQSHVRMKNTIDSAVGIQGRAWAAGQLVSYIRTPALYYLTSLLTQEGFPCIVCGTTNRDEGSYIGYFGKASDGMVDVQLISDLHKSEVYAIAELLDVPKNIMEAIPKGDVYDGRTDEQLIGAPYNFIELYTLYLNLHQDDKNRLLFPWSLEAKNQFDVLSDRLDTLNRQCAHKYIGDSPAVHLDVYERAVPGGWKGNQNRDKGHKKKSKNHFVNEFTLNPQVIQRLQENYETTTAFRECLNGFDESAYLIKELFSQKECSEVLAELNTLNWVPVGQNGYLKDYDPHKDSIGSYRASCYSDAFARLLWNRLAPSLPILRIMNDNTPTDWNGHRIWRAVGVNPLMRFIRYEKLGMLIPHYDSSYEFHEGKRTLMSLIIYLTECEEGEGGATRFIVDPQQHLPLTEREYNDWTGPPPQSAILYAIPPKQGMAVAFDHRILHDSEFVQNSSKLILRTDIIFEKCGI